MRSRPVAGVLVAVFAVLGASAAADGVSSGSYSFSPAAMGLPEATWVVDTYAVTPYAVRPGIEARAYPGWVFHLVYETAMYPEEREVLHRANETPIYLRSLQVVSAPALYVVVGYQTGAQAAPAIEWGSGMPAVEAIPAGNIVIGPATSPVVSPYFGDLVIGIIPDTNDPVGTVRGAAASPASAPSAPTTSEPLAPLAPTTLEQPTESTQEAVDQFVLAVDALLAEPYIGTPSSESSLDSLLAALDNEDLVVNGEILGEIDDLFTGSVFGIPTEGSVYYGPHHDRVQERLRAIFDRLEGRAPGLSKAIEALEKKHLEFGPGSLWYERVEAASRIVDRLEMQIAVPNRGERLVLRDAMGAATPSQRALDSLAHLALPGLADSADIRALYRAPVLLDAVLGGSLGVERRFKTDHEAFIAYGKLALAAGSGNCTECAAVSAGAVMEARLTRRDLPLFPEFEVLADKTPGSSHVFVVTGRAPNSLLQDPATWGDRAIVVDLWDGQAYPGRNLAAGPYDLYVEQPIRPRPQALNSKRLVRGAYR